VEFIRKPWVKYALIALVVGIFAWQVVGRSMSDSGAAPNFTLTNQDGEQISLSDYRGQVVILDFWATWCPPCKAEIPGFVNLHNEHKDDGLAIIGVSLDRNGWNDVRPFLKNYEVDYPVVLGNMDLVEAYGGIRSIPTTFVLDKQGKVHKKYVGYRPEQVFEGDFRALQ